MIAQLGRPVHIKQHVARSLRTTLLFHHLQRIVVPLIRQSPTIVAILALVVSIRIDEVRHLLMEIVVFSEHATKLQVFIRFAKLVTGEESHLVSHTVIPFVIGDTSLKK